MVPLNQFTFCRLCLCTSTSLMDIFDERNIEGLIVKETIEDLLQLKIVRVHGCPWLTCDSCRNKLNDFRRFKINCMESKVAFESRFPQQVVLMPGSVGINAAVAGTNKPQTILLLPVSSMPAFTKGGFQVGAPLAISQVGAPNGTNQLIWSGGGGVVIPGNASVSDVSQVIASTGQVPSLNNVLAPKCNQFIQAGNFLLPSHVHVGPSAPVGVSQTNVITSNSEVVTPPFANVSDQNGGLATLSTRVTTPCPASMQSALLQPSEEISSANDVLLQPKEEPMEEEEKPCSMDDLGVDGRILLQDDYLPSSPVCEDEKNILPQEYCEDVKPVLEEIGGCGNHQVPDESFSDELVNVKASAATGDVECKEEMLAVRSEIESEIVEVSSQGGGDEDLENRPLDSGVCVVEETQRQYLLDSYECCMCFEIFNRPDLLKAHRLTHKDDPRPFKCRVCAKTFPSRKRQVQHMKNHYNVPNRFERCQENNLCEGTQCQHLFDSYECCMCFEVYDRADLLESHKLTHKDDPQPYKCRLCSKKFAARKGQVLHMKYHYNVPNRYECSECHIGFAGINNLTMHLKAHRREKVQRSYKCSVCPEEFPSGHSRDKHEARHSAPRNACTHCDKVFYTRGELYDHIKMHESNRTHKCNVCNKGFAKRTYLKYHMQVHDAVKRYACKECGLKFAQYSSLWQHQKRHKDKNRYVCDVCGKGFVLNYALRKHKERHFNGKKRGGRRPKVKCIVGETHGSTVNEPNGEAKLGGDKSDASGDSVVRGVAEDGSTGLSSVGECKGMRDDADVSCTLECNGGPKEEAASLETNVQSAGHGVALIGGDFIPESSGYAEVNDKQRTYRDKSCTLSVP